MAFDHMGIALDFDFLTLLAEKGGLILTLREKQPHFITGAAVGARPQYGKLDHPAGVVPKTIHSQNVVSFQLTG